MLQNKNFVIMGCLQGIGKETLKTFAENGSGVIFACAYKKEEHYEEFCRHLQEENDVTIYPVYFDMMDNSSIKAAAREIQSKKVNIHGWSISRELIKTRCSRWSLIRTCWIHSRSIFSPSISLN